MELAGIRSATATNVSGYDVVIAGGPMYNAKVVSTVEELKKLLPGAQIEFDPGMSPAESAMLARISPTVPHRLAR